MTRWAVYFVCLGVVGCQDPVHSDQVDALGPEAAGIPRGPLHRAGQPCTVCHGDLGPASPEFAIAGTIFQDKDNTLPLPNATVEIVDSNGSHDYVTTNCAGNFWLTTQNYAPAFPVWITVHYGNELPAEMKTPIFRERSCANCHKDPPSQTSVGHVYLSDSGKRFGVCQ